MESLALSAASGVKVWLKVEALQPSGSFKLRGIGYACQVYKGKGAERFVSSSGGNAGLAVAYAGRRLKIPVTVVVPETTSERAKEMLLLERAEVLVHGVSWQEADDLARSLLTDTDAYLHPFDDPLLWQGHASMIDEVFTAGLRPDAVVLSVGGGGLLSGVVQGLERNGAPDIPIIAVETSGAASLRAARDAGEPVALARITSVATSLGAKRVCEQAFRYSQERPIRSVVLSDRAALAACKRYLDDHRILVEPACGASLAAVYENAPELQGLATVLVIVCGGVGVTMEQIQKL